MEFLKELLGAELYAQIEAKINEYNGNEANKDNQIKLANVGTGEYTSVAKYDALNAEYKGKEAELTAANKLIAELQKATKGDEAVQSKIAGYETQVADLQAQLEDTKIKSAIKVALLSEKAVDVDYLTFKLNEKLKEKGETLALDENENIKGWDALRDGLKTQFPAMFESGTGQRKVLGDNKLPDSDTRGDAVTKEDFAKMGYKSRVELKSSNPELYSKLAN